jgi:hypothetical protein
MQRPVRARDECHKSLNGQQGCAGSFYLKVRELQRVAGGAPCTTHPWVYPLHHALHACMGLPLTLRSRVSRLEDMVLDLLSLIIAPGPACVLGPLVAEQEGAGLPVARLGLAVRWWSRGARGEHWPSPG